MSITFDQALGTLHFSEQNYIKLIKNITKKIKAKATSGKKSQEYALLVLQLEKLSSAHGSLEKAFDDLKTAKALEDRIEAGKKIEKILEDMPKLYLECITHPLATPMLATSLKNRFKVYKELLEMTNEASPEEEAQNMSLIKKTFELTGMKVRKNISEKRRESYFKKKEFFKIENTPLSQAYPVYLHHKKLNNKQRIEKIEKDLNKDEKIKNFFIKQAKNDLAREGKITKIENRIRMIKEKLDSVEKLEKRGTTVETGTPVKRSQTEKRGATVETHVTPVRRTQTENRREIKERKETLRREPDKNAPPIRFTPESKRLSKPEEAVTEIKQEQTKAQRRQKKGKKVHKEQLIRPKKK